MSIVLAGKLTWDDIKDLPESAGKTEIVDGELRVSPIAGLAHQRAATRLTVKIGPFVAERSLGEFFGSPVHVILDEHVNFEPDLCFVSKKRKSILRETVIKGAPDLVIEIVSESNRKRDEITKFRYYEEFGVGELWLVDLRDRLIRVYALNERRYSGVGDFGPGESILSPTLTGLELDPADVFA